MGEGVKVCHIQFQRAVALLYGRDGQLHGALFWFFTLWTSDRHLFIFLKGEGRAPSSGFLAAMTLSPSADYAIAPAQPSLLPATSAFDGIATACPAGLRWERRHLCQAQLS